MGSSDNRSEHTIHTPYELVFDSPGFEDDRFPGIQAESESRGVPTEVPERFLLLGTVGSLLQEILPDGADTAEFSRHGALLYQAYHYWRHGKADYEISEGDARTLITDPPATEDWDIEPPGRAGYVELPRHLFWARIEDDATPEPLAGFFWTVADPTDSVPSHGGRLQLLLALGLFPGRPGFSTIALDLRLDLLRSAPASELAGDPDRKDFENILPGGELQDWYGLLTDLEAMKLVSRSFGLLERLGTRAEPGPEQVAGPEVPELVRGDDE